MSTPLGTGVVIPVCTPLDAAGEVDETSLRRLLEHLLHHRVHGVFILGTCGEFGFLTDPQREQVVRATVEHVAGRVPVLVGITDTASARVIEQARALLPLGADGAVATAPFFAETGRLEIIEHFRLIKAALGDIPLFGYENPPRVNGTSIPADIVLELAADGTFTGYKDSSGDADYLAAILHGRTERGLDGFRVLSGSEVQATAALREGADGLVPGLGNVDPAGYVDLYETATSDVTGSDAVQQRLRELFAIVRIPTHAPMGGSSRALGAFKAGLRLLDVIDDDRCAAPSILYDDADRAEVAAILAAWGPAAASENAPSCEADDRHASTVLS